MPTRAVQNVAQARTARGSCRPGTVWRQRRHFQTIVLLFEGRLRVPPSAGTAAGAGGCNAVMMMIGPCTGSCAGRYAPIDMQRTASLHGIEFRGLPLNFPGKAAPEGKPFSTIRAQRLVLAALREQVRSYLSPLRSSIASSAAVRDEGAAGCFLPRRGTLSAGRALCCSKCRICGA